MGRIDVQRIKSDGHDVLVGRHALANLAEHLTGDAFAESKVFILVDENTLHHCLPVLLNKVEPLREAEVIEIQAGEESKDIDVVKQLWSALGELKADRSSVLINLGGGVISDLGGLVAGTFKRGIRFINIPTTLLAQVDASVGGKVGINFDGIKNQIGLFNAPDAVYVDPEFLSTLNRKELLSGFAEMVKHALICDAGYWDLLKNVSFYDLPALDPSIVKSILIKSEIVNSDPFELGRRKILNFGHTIGHAVESYAMESDLKALLHGEAIALGMVCEAYISHRAEFINERELRDVTQFIFSHYSKVELPQLANHRIIELMLHDKKNKNREIQMCLLSGIGDCVYNQVVRAEHVIEALQYYGRWVG